MQQLSWLVVMRLLTTIALFAWCLLPVGGATLEKLSLEQMAQKSTEIVRGRVTASRTAKRGPVIYTFATVEVLERWKGVDSGTAEVAVPGGALGQYRQTFSGAPALHPGDDYILFLWTGKSGVTQIIGLSQGVLDVVVDDSGAMTVQRAAASEVMLSPETGAPAQGEAFRMELPKFRERVRQVLTKEAR